MSGGERRGSEVVAFATKREKSKAEERALEGSEEGVKL